MSLEGSEAADAARPRRVAVCTGDPAGIGPEVSLKAARYFAGQSDVQLILLGCGASLAAAAKIFVPELKLQEVSGKPRQISTDKIATMPLESPGLEPNQRGRAGAVGGRLAFEAVQRATDGCLANAFDAMVTAPVSKEAIEMSGQSFHGHTEWIAERCGRLGEEMMTMSHPKITVGYVTTHLPLVRVATALEGGRVLRCIELLCEYVWTSKSDGRPVAVCGINPHAGENGLLGGEDREILLPAIRKAQQGGCKVEGPLPADTLFVPRFRRKYSAILTIYHDQGGIPFKMLAFEDGVNLTLGLPIIRTSVDHGTAWDIAWKGVASATSMIAAIEEALRLSLARRAKGSR